MQMSRTQLFVFVEGKQCDPYFFAQVCSSAIDPQTTYEITTARQLPGDTGGKQALINFFTFLRERRSLITDLDGRKTACIFFMDKDVDDLKRSKKRSPHLCYTQYYDVQNYVFLHGDLVKASAAAASVDPRKLQDELGDAFKWCERAASLWIDWISLCLRLIEDDIGCEANYRVSSRVQVRFSGQTDPTMLDDCIRRIARRIGCPVAVFRGRLASSRAKVDRYFVAGEHHRIFKGKWFALILADDIDRIMGEDPYDGKGLSGRLACAVAATLDFSDPWTDHFKKSLSQITKTL